MAKFGENGHYWKTDQKGQNLKKKLKMVKIGQVKIG